MRINATTISTAVEGHRGVFESSSTNMPAGAYSNTQPITMEDCNGKIVALRECWQKFDSHAAAKCLKPSIGL
jgi:hypothetical protein